MGNILPDPDNLAVAIASLTKDPTEGLHRKFTHSLFFTGVVIFVFLISSQVTKQPCWNNPGLSLNPGILMHLLLGLLIWFNGVEICWPIPSWIKLPGGFILPDWWTELMLPLELLFFALFYNYLDNRACKHPTDRNFLRQLRLGTILQLALYVIFTLMVYTLKSSFPWVWAAALSSARGRSCREGFNPL